jgi:alanine racemase
MLVANNLTATVDSEEGAKALAEAGRSAGRVPEAHLKLDTGMSRFGIWSTDEAALNRTIRVPGIRWDGVYTHLATASDRSPAAARRQLDSYQITMFSIASRIVQRARGAAPPEIESLKVPAWMRSLATHGTQWFHALNSSGTLLYAEESKQTNMVRVGTLLYGQYPSRHVPRPLDLKPTWAYKTRIVSLRRIPPGRSVGYGAEWTARRDSVIATVPVGYYDGLTVEPLSVWRRQGGAVGFLKRLRGRNRVNIHTPHGPAPVVGRVAAQSAMLDVTDLPGIAVGDVVEVPARRVLVGEHIPRVAV